MNLIAAIESRLGTGWSIVDELGTGATSRVYLAKRVDTGERMVVKVMKSGAAEKERSQYFLLEMQVLQKMSHPNVVPISDAGEAQGVLYFTMPFIEGETMRQRLSRDGAFPIGDAVRLARDIAIALGHVHSNGVVHRDVKPENILLTPTGQAVLLDFGHARAPAIMPNADSRDARKYIVGTANYVSPEQVSGRRVADSRSDLYSLGCVLLEMLTGMVPFAASSARESMQRRVDEPPPDVRALRDVPDEVAAVLKRAMMVDPAERYMSADQMAKALGAALDLLPVS